MPTTASSDKLKEAHERLTEAVESIVSGDDWKRMLQVVSKFHQAQSSMTMRNILVL